MQFIKTNGRHRRLEGLPLVFTVLVTVSILIGGLVEFIPMAMVDENVPRIERVQPFTALELAGRDLYIREGCNNCHSQMVRPFRHELERYGEYTKPGETIYEHPHVWGSKRTGPDLARVGGKYPHLWHVRHMENPRSTSPNSIMPTYEWMFVQDTRYDRLTRVLGVMQTLGVPYTDAEVESAPAHARTQAAQIAAEIIEQGGPEGLADKEIVAMIAYLQRLGTDIRNDPAAPADDLNEAGLVPAPNQPVAEARTAEENQP